MIENRTNQDIWNMGDENVVNFVYSRLTEEQQHRFSLLNNKYNIGCTGFEDRYESAEKPICVAAFKADEEKEVRKFVDKNIVNKDLLDIFEKHNLRKEPELSWWEGQ